MYTRRLLLSLTLAVTYLYAQDTALQVTCDVKNPLTLSADDLAKMPRSTVRTTNNGMETVYRPERQGRSAMHPHA